MEGTLTPAAVRRVEEVVGGREALVIVLRDRDRRVCEDMGRQLRELLRATSPRLPAVVLVDPGSEEAYRGYMRREHLRATLAVLAPDSLLVAQSRLPTPAVLVRRGSRAAGVAHPVRFPNLRVRSYADELQPRLR